MRIVKVPVLDRPVAAGRASDSDDDYQIVGYRYMPTPLFDNPNDRYVVMRVSGDSLIDARIHSGDWVMYRMTESAPSGSLAVIATPNGLTVKFFHPRPDGTVSLESANAKFRPQVWLESELVIRGVVVFSGIDWACNSAVVETSSTEIQETPGESSFDADKDQWL